MDYTSIITAFIGMIGIAVPAYLLHKREMAKIQLELEEKLNKKEAELEEQKTETKGYELRGNVLDKILDIVLLNDLKTACTTIFKKTKADRFLILIAINGKVDFKTVSVIFEQHKNSTSSAIASYKSLRVDHDYVQMLKDTERNGVTQLNVAEMKPCLLKEIYQMEGVKHSKVRHLLRKPLDEENHCLIYSSIATHTDEAFNVMEKVIIQTQMDSVIKPTILKMLE